MSQTAFAEMLGVSQPVVSEFEANDSIPQRHQQTIRAEAKARNLEWDDNWLFEKPEAAE